VALNKDTNGNLSTSYNAHSFTSPSAGAMHLYSIVFDRTQAVESQVSVYVDGSAVSLSDISTPNAVSGNFANSTLYWMSRDNASLFGGGTLDEVRVSSTARSAGWIATEYNNQSSPSTFYTVGAATAQ
jgi:methylaspartate ammonia-lyase